MITVETVGKIRRRHFVKGESISRIARETRLSRNTVKRYLRNAATDGLETVTVAFKLALEAGAVSSDYVLNAISRLKAPPRSAESGRARHS